MDDWKYYSIPSRTRLQKTQAEGEVMEIERNYEAKQDKDKIRLELVPMEILNAIGRVRTYAREKYPDTQSWRTVEKERHVGSLLRHLVAYRQGEDVDQESGLKHLEHLACNLAFILELER